MNLTTTEDEMKCLLHAAEQYSKVRTVAGKPTSIIDTLIERLKMSPNGHDLVFVPRPSPVSEKCSDCESIAVKNGRCLVHQPKDPFK